MKNALIIWATILFFSPTIQSQICPTPNDGSNLNGNNIRGHIPNSGALFYNFENPDAESFGPIVPQGLDPIPTIFAGGIWLGGKNQAGETLLSVVTYSSSFQGYSPGPIINDNGQINFDCENFNRDWEVFGFEIQQHLADFTDNGVVDSQVENIYAYPGNENPHFEIINGFSLPSSPQGLAPFFDENNDGIYNPDDGDFPLPENVDVTVIPSQIIWSVFNTNNETNNPGGENMTMEIQQTAWSLYCDDNEVLNNTIFTSHKIINRGTNTVNSLIFSNWTDFDLGCYTDDFMGCIPDLNTFYAFNEDSIDGETGGTCIGGLPTFGDNPPVQAVTFLNQEMSSFVPVHNDAVGNVPPQITDPTTATEFDNYMNGKWKDGSPFTVGGNGYGGTTPTSFLFPDNPGDPAGWSMNTSLLQYGDRRTIANINLADQFAPAAVTKIDMAYTFYQDENLNQYQTVDLVYDNTPLLQQMYDSKFQMDCTSMNVAVEDLDFTNIKISPNPSSGFLYIQTVEPPSHLALFDIYGKKVLEKTSGFSVNEELNISHFPVGVYFLKININGKEGVKKIIKH